MRVNALEHEAYLDVMRKALRHPKVLVQMVRDPSLRPKVEAAVSAVDFLLTDGAGPLSKATAAMARRFQRFARLQLARTAKERAA
jgi:hypothetical protein